MDPNDFKLKLLEQKVEVMQKEISTVLNEMQVTIQAIAQTYSTALKVIMQRLNNLETPPIRTEDEGKEL